MLIVGGDGSASAGPAPVPESPKPISSLLPSAARYGSTEAGKRAPEPIVVTVNDASGAPVPTAVCEQYPATAASLSEVELVFGTGPRLAIRQRVWNGGEADTPLPLVEIAAPELGDTLLVDGRRSVVVSLLPGRHRHEGEGTLRIGQVRPPQIGLG